MIVSSAWPLVAALLRNEPGMRGILYCAVGAGERAWDTASPSPVAGPEVKQLRNEIARVAIAPADMVYLDAAGRVTKAPTHRLALSVRVAAAQSPRELREFGLFGGDATATPGSGRLLNYAIHPVIALGPGQSLTRMIRLSFRPGGGGPAGEADVPFHWLAEEPVSIVDGVGASVAEALKASKVSSVRLLAALDLTNPVEGVSLSRAVELKAKARLAIQTAAQLVRVPGLEPKTVDDVLTGEAADSEPAERLQAQLGLLQVALDARWLKRLKVGDLVASEAPQ